MRITQTEEVVGDSLLFRKQKSPTFVAKLACPSRKCHLPQIMAKLVSQSPVKNGLAETFFLQSDVVLRRMGTGVSRQRTETPQTYPKEVGEGNREPMLMALIFAKWRLELASDCLPQRRSDPHNLSQHGFCRGLCGAVFTLINAHCLHSRFACTVLGFLQCGRSPAKKMVHHPVLIT